MPPSNTQNTEEKPPKIQIKKRKKKRKKGPHQTPKSTPKTPRPNEPQNPKPKIQANPKYRGNNRQIGNEKKKCRGGGTWDRARPSLITTARSKFLANAPTSVSHQACIFDIVLL
jgi:hypothetical protein